MTSGGTIGAIIGAGLLAGSTAYLIDQLSDPYQRKALSDLLDRALDGDREAQKVLGTMLGLTALMMAGGVAGARLGRLRLKILGDATLENLVATKKLQLVQELKNNEIVKNNPALLKLVSKLEDLVTPEVTVKSGAEMKIGDTTIKITQNQQGGYDITILVKGKLEGGQEIKFKLKPNIVHELETRYRISGEEIQELLGRYIKMLANTTQDAKFIQQYVDDLLRLLEALTDDEFIGFMEKSGININSILEAIKNGEVKPLRSLISIVQEDRLAIPMKDGSLYIYDPKTRKLLLKAKIENGIIKVEKIYDVHGLSDQAKTVFYKLKEIVDNTGVSWSELLSEEPSVIGELIGVKPEIIENVLPEIKSVVKKPTLDQLAEDLGITTDKLYMLFTEFGNPAGMEARVIPVQLSDDTVALIGQHKTLTLATSKGTMIRTKANSILFVDKQTGKVLAEIRGINDAYSLLERNIFIDNKGNFLMKTTLRLNPDDIFIQGDRIAVWSYFKRLEDKLPDVYKKALQLLLEDEPYEKAVNRVKGYIDRILQTHKPSETNVEVSEGNVKLLAKQIVDQMKGIKDLVKNADEVDFMSIKSGGANNIVVVVPPKAINEASQNLTSDQAKAILDNIVEKTAERTGQSTTDIYSMFQENPKQALNMLVKLTGITQTAGAIILAKAGLIPAITREITKRFIMVVQKEKSIVGEGTGSLSTTMNLDIVLKPEIEEATTYTTMETTKTKPVVLAKPSYKNVGKSKDVHIKPKVIEETNTAYITRKERKTVTLVDDEAQMTTIEQPGKGIIVEIPYYDVTEKVIPYYVVVQIPIEEGEPNKPTPSASGTGKVGILPPIAMPPGQASPVKPVKGVLRGRQKEVIEL